MADPLPYLPPSMYTQTQTDDPWLSSEVYGWPAAAPVAPTGPTAPGGDTGGTGGGTGGGSSNPPPTPGLGGAHSTSNGHGNDGHAPGGLGSATPGGSDAGLGNSTGTEAGQVGPGGGPASPSGMGPAIKGVSPTIGQAALNALGVFSGGGLLASALTGNTPNLSGIQAVKNVTRGLGIGSGDGSSSKNTGSGVGQAGNQPATGGIDAGGLAGRMGGDRGGGDGGDGGGGQGGGTGSNAGPGGAGNASGAGGREYSKGGMTQPATPWFIRKSASTVFHNGGLFHSSIPGRTDKINASVPGGSYVIPADVVSGLGQGNTLAGSKNLDRMFHSLPFGVSSSGGSHRAPHFAGGGRVNIVVAGGEYNVHPDDVKRFGHGSLEKGHDRLDDFVKAQRAHIAATMKKLPGPKKN